jgi:type II secretory pathway pseudopilin PulG
MTSVRFRSLAKQAKQDGFALMGIVIAIAIIGMILVTYYWRQAQQNKITEAQILGNQLAEYVSAVQARMSGDGTFAVGTYSDLSFLKSKNNWDLVSMQVLFVLSFLYLYK